MDATNVSHAESTPARGLASNASSSWSPVRAASGMDATAPSPKNTGEKPARPTAMGSAANAASPNAATGSPEARSIRMPEASAKSVPSSSDSATGADAPYATVLSAPSSVRSNVAPSSRCSSYRGPTTRGTLSFSPM